MKILVFDDNKMNRDAAVAQLGQDHDLTVVGTYDEAQALLTPKVDYDKVREIVKDLLQSTDEEKMAWHEAWDTAVETSAVYPDFDVILTDLLVPASGQHQGRGGRLVGEEMPVGVFIGLLAAVKGKAKYVAVFTDSDHHSHPASACFDVFNAGESSPTSFMVNGCQMLLSNTHNWVSYFAPDDLSRELEYDEYRDLDPSQKVRTKNWKALLEYLLTN